MAGYTRQSTATIINGAGITAPPLNAEFNQLVSAFNSSSGHTHTGGTGDGPQIPLATSVTGYLPLANGGVGGKNNVTNSIPTANDDSGDGYAPGSLWENSSTGRIYVCVGNTSGAAVWRELVQQDLAGTMITDVDINGGDIDGTDIGVASVGTGAFSTISATGNITGNLVGNSTGLHTGAVTGDVTGNITSSGTSTFGAIDVNGGAIDGTVIGANVLAAISGSTITGTSFVGPLTGTVAGNVTGNLAGNVTASSGTTVLNNLTVNGTIDVTSTTIENVSDPTSAQQAATKNYVDTQVSNLVSSAPAALDTLNELAAAIGDDANFSTTVTNSIAAKLPLAGGTLTGNINAGGNTVTNLATPSANSDAATKAYVDTGVGSNAAAATSATNAANSATAAANSATAAASSLDTFQDTYLGAASSDPSTDLDGNALATGALYFNSTSNVTRVYTGSEWQTASASIEGIKADFVYVATAGQTVFSGNDSSSNTMTIDTAGLVNVFLNGIRLITTTDYTVSAANNRVTLNAGATAGDLLEVEVFGNFAGQSGSSVAITGGTINNTTFNNVTYSGNITTTGTVDGRDVSVDGTKLDGIEAGATADQTAAEVRTLVESAADSNVFTDADHSKLNSIEASATADQTDAEIRTAVGNASDSNIFTDADHSKLDGIAAGATNYVHPTGAGNNHIPTGGSADQVLTYASSGTAAWADLNAGFLSNVVNVTSNTTATTSQSGTLFVIKSATAILTLPAPAVGLYFGVVNETTTPTLMRVGGSNSVFANNIIFPLNHARSVGVGTFIGMSSTKYACDFDPVSAAVISFFRNGDPNATNYSETWNIGTNTTAIYIAMHSGTNGAFYTNTSSIYLAPGLGGAGFSEKLITSSIPTTLTIAGDYRQHNSTANISSPPTSSRLTCVGTGVNMYVQRGTGTYYNQGYTQNLTGGTASGGDFNASGGSGSGSSGSNYYSASTVYGGGGGAGSPAGTGGNASTSASSSNIYNSNGTAWGGYNSVTQVKHGGGTGGNHGTTSGGGAAGTKDSNSITMTPYIGKEFHLAGGGSTLVDQAATGLTAVRYGLNIGAQFGHALNDLEHISNTKLFYAPPVAREASAFSNYNPTEAGCTIIEFKG